MIRSLNEIEGFASMADEVQIEIAQLFDDSKVKDKVFKDISSTTREIKKVHSTKTSNS